MSSSQLTNSMIFQRGRFLPPTRNCWLLSHHMGMYQNQSCYIWEDEHPFTSYLGFTRVPRFWLIPICSIFPPLCCSLRFLPHPYGRTLPFMVIHAAFFRSCGVAKIQNVRGYVGKTLYYTWKNMQKICRFIHHTGKIPQCKKKNMKPARPTTQPVLNVNVTT